MKSRATFAAAAIVAAFSPAAAAPIASGGEIERTRETWQTCEAPVLEQPFERFGDRRDYVLAPSGAFEHVGLDITPLELEVDLSQLGWQSSPGAGITVGNEAYYVRRATDATSLTLPDGASATSPAMCIDLHYPHMRLVTRSSDASARLRVQVIYPNAGDPRFKWVDTLTGNEGTEPRLGWRVSNDIPLRPERGGETPGPRLAALRFKALSGNWRVDDIYVDPRRHR